MEKLLENSAEIQKYKNMVFEASPVIGTTHQIFCDELYKDGVLSGKMKRIVGIAVAIRTGSLSCLVNQTKNAVELGATKEEIMEAAAVAIAMGGKSTIEYGARVIRVLEELEKW
jgi:AhpD family alkylhydroperoxidase